MVRCPSCVRPSVCALTFSLNIFFSETTYRILMKFHRNVPAMVFFRISSKNLISSKTVVCHGNKTEKKFENFENLLVRNHKARATKFGMQLYLMGLYQVSSNYSPGVKFDPTPRVTSFTWDYIGRILEFSLYVAIRPRVTKFCM